MQAKPGGIKQIRGMTQNGAQFSVPGTCGEKDIRKVMCERGLCSAMLRRMGRAPRIGWRAVPRCPTPAAEISGVHDPRMGALSVARPSCVGQTGRVMSATKFLAYSKRRD